MRSGTGFGSEGVTRYARAADGAYLAYRVLGDGPVDIAWQLEWLGNVDTVWEHRPTSEWILGLASFARVIIHDRRGTGASSRNVALPTLEQRVADTAAVLDAVGSRTTVLGGALEAGAPNVLFAATMPERVASVFWWYPAPRTSRSDDYAFGADEQFLAAYRERIEKYWGSDDYVYPDLVATSPDYSNVPWGWLTRQTATPDVALEMDRIYNETDVRAAMPSMTCPVLMLARDEDLLSLRYLATLLRRPDICTMPGEGPMSPADMERALEAIRVFVGVEEKTVAVGTVFRAVLFTDVVGSTRMQQELGDVAYRDVIEAHHAIVRTSLARWQGTEWSNAGDGFYATFLGPAGAVRCAHEIAQAVRALGLEIRAGVHVGECRIIDRQVGGLTVSIGARIAEQAGPSEVLVSQSVKDLVAGAGLHFDDVGPRSFKGVSGSWPLFRASEPEAP